MRREEDGSDPQLNASISETGVDLAQPDATENQPLYRVFKDTKIPVSKSAGKLWESRIAQGKASRADIEDAWAEAIRYYENDQTPHRTKSKTNASGSGKFTRHLGGEQWSETENVVFANACIMLPMIYAKNPSVECTAINTETNEQFAKSVETTVNALFQMNDAPGLNLKTKARRGVLSALLTNRAYLKLGWTFKQDSSEEALSQLQQLSTELTNAKDAKTIREVEGKISAIEDKIDFLSPAGPTVKLVSPFRIIVDPAGTEPDHSDANWIAEFDYMQTSTLNAMYATKEGEQYRSVYEPSHVLKAGTTVDSIEEQVNNFSLFDKETKSTAYGYSSDAAFRNAQYTKVWYVWDKTTRRLMLYADNDWCWPLWVWDDPYKLLGFFPYYSLWFHETPDGAQPKGEVTYILDQQDSINEIKSEVARARKWVKNNLFYDKNRISQTDVEQVLKGPDGTARGLDVPEGMKLTDLIFSLAPPSMQHPELWNYDSQLASINRTTGINDAQRGAQYKTNTTNKAVEAYGQNVDIRVDEKVDAIEDWLGRFAFGLAQLLVANWKPEDVAKLVGTVSSQGWKQLTDPQQFRAEAQLRIIGGSTEKPTSKMKKKQALEIAQVMGQFASGIPAMGMLALKVVVKAFEDDVVITPEEWQMVQQSMQDTANKAGAGPGGEQGGQPPPDPNAEQDAHKAQIAEVIAKLAPEQKQKLEQLVQQGTPARQALEMVSQAQPQAK